MSVEISVHGEASKGATLNGESHGYSGLRENNRNLFVFLAIACSSIFDKTLITC